jgi:hypothetical protein
MSILWVRIRSFHALANAGGTKTLCGRSPALSAEVHDTLPAGKSCETCLRIIARKVDA